MDSIIKGYELGYKKGQNIKYFNKIRKIKFGKFMMVGSIDGFIVVKNENGEAELVEFGNIVK